MARWRAHAVDVEFFAKTEGSPLIECRVGDVVLQLFERTGPYLAHPGSGRLIVNPIATSLGVESEPVAPTLEVDAVSRIKAAGRVLEVDGRVAVIDAGMPLVVYSLDPLPPEVTAGASVNFESLPPLHGFVMPATSSARRRDGRSTDEDI